MNLLFLSYLSERAFILLLFLCSTLLYINTIYGNTITTTSTKITNTIIYLLLLLIRRLCLG